MSAAGAPVNEITGKARTGRRAPDRDRCARWCAVGKGCSFMRAQDIAGMLQGARGHGTHYVAKCPCHQDDSPSLSIDERDGRVMLYDHGGCDTGTILAALGLTFKDLIIDPDPDWKPRRGGKPVESGEKQEEAHAHRGPAPASRTARGDRQRRTSAGQGAGASGAGSGAGEKVETVGGITVHTTGGNGDVAMDAGAGHAGGGAADGASGGADHDHRGVAAAPGMVGDDRGGAAGAPGGPAGAAAAGPGPAAVSAGNENGEKDDGKQIDWNHPDKVYSYTDWEGKEIYQVVRYHYTNAKGKTFRQRRYAPGDPKANAGGWVNSVPEEIRELALYRMPRIREAVAKGEPVYVVEGEKDVETLERLGKYATCNAGGAGKWRDRYAQYLAGADLIILPDNDPRNDKGGYTGQDHAFDVAMKCRWRAKRIRIVNLKEACPQIPEKGDVTDLMEILGDVEGMDALARQVAATRDFDPQMVPFWLTPMEQAELLYAHVAGYGVQSGAIVQKNGDTIKPLCDFVVIPRSEIIRDDGVETERYFTLDGWNQSGAKLERVIIRSGELDGMNWIREKWGYGAAIVPGSTTKAKVAWCIAKVGQMMSKTVVEYNHTGWRKIAGKWTYLYQGGAIGAAGVTVNLEEGLKTYRLDGSGNPDFAGWSFGEAAKKTLSMLNVAKRSTVLALLGVMFLSPLREWMAQTDIVPAFSLFLHGATQTRKSTLAALAMSHFGNFHAKNAPTNFKSTGNSITRKAFMAKDMPLWVDDFHPTDSQQEKRAMNAVAQRLARAFGDGADRGRLNADGSLQVNRPPRSLAVITGEDLPAVGASGLARFFIVDVDKGDIPVTKELSELQEYARQGWLQKSMRGYILWLEKQVGQLPEQLHEMFGKYREIIRAKGAGDQERAPEALACILIGLRMMTAYCVDTGAMTDSEARAMIGEALEGLTEASRRQSREMESEKPTRIFLDTLSELIASGKVTVRDLVLDGEKKGPYPTDNMIGYRDNAYYYFLPNMAFKEVSRVCREEGHEFPVSLKALYKHLKADGAVPGIRMDENPAKPKTIDGKSVRVLRIDARQIEGSGEKSGQLDFDSIAVDVDLPFETKKGE